MEGRHESESSSPKRLVSKEASIPKSKVQIRELELAQSAAKSAKNKVLSGGLSDPNLRLMEGLES